MIDKKKILEADLYKPIQKYFIKEGYEVYGEVKDCDIVAIKNDELIVIELKLNLSIDLLIQATKRQRLTNQVYIAVPRPSYSKRSKRWTDVCHLVRRLELGLIMVSFTGNQKRTEVVFHPSAFQRKKVMNQSKRKREAILNEIKGRSADYNIGGSNRAKIMTAYKENCIQIACYLDHIGELSPKKLIQLGTGNKTPSILTKNYYGWFERVKRGVYKISERGNVGLKEYPELVNYYVSMLNSTKVEDK